MTTGGRRTLRSHRQRVPSLAGLALLLMVAGSVGCSTARAPVLAELRDVPVRDVVIMIPGMTGSQLRERESGRVVWGDTHSLLAPKDGGRALALSIEDPQGSAARLEPFAPILEFRLLGVRREIYAPLAGLLEANGYQSGNLDSPTAGDDFFFFHYDWRLGAGRAAGSLARQLESLQRSLGTRLRVALICQSNAALIGRYLVKYGAVSLDQAEAGEVATPANVTVTKLIFVGASNGGALRVLRQLNEGRRYVRVFGRRMQPETLFTMPALFEGLPAYESQLFFDAEGQLLNVDLFETDNWERYGWSIYAPAVRKRLGRSTWEELLGDEPTRRAYLRRMLDRAGRLHALLRADPPGFEPPRYYSLQNDSSATAERALLVKRQGQWRTLFFDDPEVDRNPDLLRIATAPGDGHATLRSQEWLSPRERSALARPATLTAGGHFDIILDPELQQLILEYLLE